MSEAASRRAAELYEAWREAPSLHWNQIVNPANTTPPGAVDETPHFVRRWNRVAEYVDTALARAVAEERERCAQFVEDWDDGDFPVDTAATIQAAAAALRAAAPANGEMAVTCASHSPVGDVCERPVRHLGPHTGNGATWSQS